MSEKQLNQETEQVSNNDSKEYKEERFEFALFVNDNLVCKRNFKMYNFIEGSMQTEDFTNLVGHIVRMIDNDLKSKSRVYTWYYYDPENPTEEFVNPLNEKWENTFKFVIFDNKREVFSKIWDGYGYPAAIRNNVDIANTIVKIITRTGNVFTFDDAYFQENEDRINPDLAIRRKMIVDKENLLPIITKRICETCSPWNNSPYEKLSDFTTTVTYGKGKNAKTYNLSIDQENRKYFKSWEKAVEDKTKAYFNRKK